LHRKRLQLFGVSNKMRTATHRVAAARAFGRDLLPLLASGQLVPLVDRVFPLEQLEAAKRHMDRSEHLGKIAIRME
jgi:NADPH:quinone reductase-like Zn-dependent oxidoreductase